MTTRKFGVSWYIAAYNALRRVASIIASKARRG